MPRPHVEPAGATTAQADSLSVGDLLEERYPYFVPRYQRAYAWGDDSIADFVGDIQEIVEPGAEAGSHFFGGIVCIEVTDSSPHRHKYEVVDGQQRLATFMLALSCVARSADQVIERANGMRQGSQAAPPDTAAEQPSLTAAEADLLIARAETLRDDTRDRYIRWRDSNLNTGSRTWSPRLSLSLADDDMFQALVNQNLIPAPARQSHELLIAAHAAMEEMVNGYMSRASTLNEEIDRLVRMREALVRDSYLIHIVSSQRQQAYRLFSVLNHRGESLSNADLLRSRSLELLSMDDFGKQHERVAVLWDEMLINPAADVEQYLLVCFASRTGRRTQGDVFDAVAPVFLPADAPRDDAGAEAFVRRMEGLRDELSLFMKLKNGRWPYERTTGSHSERVSQWQIDRLKRMVITLKHDLSLPLLLSAATSLNEDDFAALVFMLEIFVFRYKIICNQHAQSMQNIYYPAAKAMRDQGHSYSLTQLRDDLRALLKRKAGDDIFRTLLADTLKYNNSSQRANIREFLTTLEDHHDWLDRHPDALGDHPSRALPEPTTSSVYDIDQVTIEHIYPERAGADVRDDNLEELKHSLGNLTFLWERTNGEAANKSFDVKCARYYASSNIAMTRSLAQKSSWHAPDVIERQKMLVEQALAVFII